jgi:hypothetical protein
MTGSDESRMGAFFVLVAFALVLTLTMMAFSALAPQSQLAGWEAFSTAAN